MKKHWYTYLLAIVGALLLGNCAKNDVLNPEPGTDIVRAVPISFKGSYVDHATTRHSCALRDHLPTMGVWGWCTSQADSCTAVFTDQAVVYNPDSARWEYSPLKYWRLGCQYNFHAYAPHHGQTTAQVSIDTLTHMISIKDVTLHGYNLQQTPTDSVKELFRGTPDTDWMISRSGQTAIGAAGMDIEFTMQHILAKLNIRIRVCPDVLDRPHLDYITADSISVSKLPAKGHFTQKLTHTPITGNPEEAAIEEWTALAPQLRLCCTNGCTLKSTPTYLIESLLIPHQTDEASRVVLHYTLRFTDGHTEQCRYRIPLNQAFTRFVSGYSHTLTFTICSDRITFEAGTSDWVREQ